jgi:hypothetical protein
MKTRIRRARCKHVMAVLNNQLQTVELLREEVHPPVADFPEDPMEIAVVRWRGWEVCVPLQSVVFLQTRKEIEELHALAVESARRMTAKEGMAFLVKAGIYTRDGELTPEYGGPKPKPPRTSKTHSRSCRKPSS